MTETAEKIGFIGLGVMGEPMCRHLATRSRRPVAAFDRDAEPLKRLAEHGVLCAKSALEAFEGADVTFLSLPSGAVVQEVVHGADGLLAHVRAGQTIVDLGTSPVDLTRELASAFAAAGASYVDAPVARTRAAAEAGALSVMVGAADAAAFERVRPLLETFATDVTLCGGVGCGQVVKILNNLVLFEIGLAIAEAKAIGARAGVEPALLFDTLAKGSADSFALRNHGMKAMIPGQYPLRAFSVAYARKDLDYALRLARETQVQTDMARCVETVFDEAVAADFGEHYWPVISRITEARTEAAHRSDS